MGGHERRPRADDRARRTDVLTERDGLASDWVLALHEDREGTVWVGTQGGGLDSLADGTFTSYTTREGLSAEHAVRAVSGPPG